MLYEGDEEDMQDQAAMRDDRLTDGWVDGWIGGGREDHTTIHLYCATTEGVYPIEAEVK